MNHVFKIVLALAFFSESGLSAQTVVPKGSFFADVTIPTSIRNRAFDRTMEGLFNLATGYQHNVYKGLTIGAGIKYTYFSTNNFEFNGSLGGGGTHIPGGFLKIGYEKFTTDRVSVYTGLKAGYANIMVNTDSCEIKLGGPFQRATFFVEPQIEVNVLTELGSPSAFNMILSYAWNFQEFTAEYICRDKFPGFIDEFSQGYIRYLNIGFGFKHYFGKN